MRKIAMLAAAALVLAACSKSGGAAKRKILYYRSPMNPAVHSPVPMKDQMGMDYVPVYADEVQNTKVVDGRAGFALDARRRQLIGLRVATVERRKLVRVIDTVGRIAYDPELYRTQEEFLTALTSWKAIKAGGDAGAAARAKSLLDSSRLRLRVLGLSDAQIDRLGARGKPDVGLLLAQGKGSRPWLYAEIYESELALVRPGQEVAAVSPSLPGLTFRGRIASVDPNINPKTRSVRVRVRLADPDGLLRPDLYLDARIRVDLGEHLAVPRSAVVDTGIHQFVFVDQGDGYLDPREVTLGMSAGDYFEVRSGVKEGEKVVTSGNFLVDSESQLRAAMAQFGGQ
jgi:membrane fusion protein, copper/silver efflux system